MLKDTCYKGNAISGSLMREPDNCLLYRLCTLLWKLF